MKEKIRDKTRDKLAQHLNALGIKAELAERDLTIEKIEKSWYERSLGIIFIQHGQIKWINIVKKDGSKNSPPHWRVIFAIPDGKLTENHSDIIIKTIRKKNFPLFGKVVDVNWNGEDYGLGLVDFLSWDIKAKNMAMKLGNIEIRNHMEDFQGWTLKVDRRIKPTTEHWETIQKIADYLLSLNLPYTATI